jgi:hypothetical protein
MLETVVEPMEEIMLLRPDPGEKLIAARA